MTSVRGPTPLTPTPRGRAPLTTIHPTFDPDGISGVSRYGAGAGGSVGDDDGSFARVIKLTMGYYPRGATSVSDDDDDGDQKVALWAPVAEVLVPAGGDTAYVDFEVRGKTLISSWKDSDPSSSIGSAARGATRENRNTIQNISNATRVNRNTTPKIETRRANRRMRRAREVRTKTAIASEREIVDRHERARRGRVYGGCRGKTPRVTATTRTAAARACALGRSNRSVDRSSSSGCARARRTSWTSGRRSAAAAPRANRTTTRPRTAAAAPRSPARRRSRAARSRPRPQAHRLARRLWRDTTVTRE